MHCIFFFFSSLDASFCLYPKALSLPNPCIALQILIFVMTLGTAMNMSQNADAERARTDKLHTKSDRAVFQRRKGKDW